MTKRQDPDANHRIQRLATVMRERKGSGHYAKAKAADRAWHHETMFEDAAAERDRAKAHCHRQSDFVNPMRSENAPCRRDQAQDDRRRETVNQAEARKADRHPVEPVSRDGKL